MPNRRCEVCNQMQKIEIKDWKYIDTDGPFVCSSSCLLLWIKQDREPLNLHGATNGYGVIRTNAPTHNIFRSRYEEVFSEWLNFHGLYWKFERLTFTWGAKEYTQISL